MGSSSTSLWLPQILSSLSQLATKPTSSPRRLTSESVLTATTKASPTFSPSCAQLRPESSLTRPWTKNIRPSVASKISTWAPAAFSSASTTPTAPQAELLQPRLCPEPVPLESSVNSSPSSARRPSTCPSLPGETTTLSSTRQASWSTSTDTSTPRPRVSTSLACSKTSRTPNPAPLFSSTPARTTLPVPIPLPNSGTRSRRWLRRTSSTPSSTPLTRDSSPVTSRPTGTASDISSTRASRWLSLRASPKSWDFMVREPAHSISCATTKQMLTVSFRRSKLSCVATTPRLPSMVHASHPLSSTSQP